MTDLAASLTREDFTDSVDYYAGSTLSRAVAEIKRLRRELNKAQEIIAIASNADRTGLARELAEARALLEETETYPSLQGRIDAFLSATAQKPGAAK